MPYIHQADRNIFDRYLEPLFEQYGPVLTTGQMNYLVTKMCLLWLESQKDQDYDKHNAIIGFLESAKLEFNRRALGPLEDLKMKERGDVYK
jgi:hypothetical protein